MAAVKALRVMMASSAKPYQHAMQASAVHQGQAPWGVLQQGVGAGLPAVGLPARKRGPGLAHPALGATHTDLMARGPRPIAGQPSAQLRRTQRGGAVTEVARSSEWEPWLTAADLELVRRVARKMLSDAQAMSQGPLSLATLRRMNHPYGRGRKAPGGGKRGRLGRLQRLAGYRHGISNLAIINRQSGRLAGAWRIEVGRRPGQVVVRLGNSVAYAGWLAMGTKNLRAHGPWTSAVIKHLPELNQAWLQVTQRAWYRAMAEASSGLAGVG